jgi:hypothetical protein
MPGKGSKREQIASIFKGKARETSGQASSSQTREEALEAIPEAAASPSTGNVLPRHHDHHNSRVQSP